MAIQLSQDLKLLLEKAKQHAKSMNNLYIGTEHLFLAFLDYNKELSFFLENKGVSRSVIVSFINRWSVEEVADTEPLPTPRLERVVGLARCEAKKDKQPEVTVNNLFYALIFLGGGVISLLLEHYNCSFQQLLQVIGLSMRQSSCKIKTASKDSAQIKPDSYKPLEGVLGKLGRDLTKMAREGELDPVVGRKEEIRRIMQILTRKSKNNPLLIGEAGVGKTAVIAGLAQRIVNGEAPKVLSNKRIIEISVSSLLSGMKHRGEFEEQIQKLVLEVFANKSIIVFIDEIHTIIGAGDPKGPLDMSNILKPVLARGEFPLIGATTNEEYRRYIAGDAALERRFQPVIIPEPSESETMEILKGVIPKYETHHGVKFSENSLLTAVTLAVRYLTDRHLPDKVLDILDEAASRAKLRSMPPKAVETNGLMNDEISKDLLQEIVIEVEPEQVAEVVSLWTGIPVTNMTEDESEKLADLPKFLKQRVIGQDEAVERVAKTVKLMRLGLGNPNRPGGVFLFLGPTGVGKTELAKALAQALFNSERSIIRIDMSEYMDKHSAARLIGAPPGYVGYEEGGQLTNAVKTKPYSVVLFDEIEKANKEIFDLFLQLFDDGHITDGQGRTINFCNTIIIMTSNIGSDLIAKELIGAPDSASFRQNKELLDKINEQLKTYFRIEFLNRIDDIILFNPLTQNELENVLELQLNDLLKRFSNKGIVFEVSREAKEFLLKEGYNPLLGARPLRRSLENNLAKPLAEKIVDLKAKGDIRLKNIDIKIMISFALGKLVFDIVDEP